MKYLIAGLGNIGTEYNKTRHNIGFDILEHIADLLNTHFELNRHSYIAKATYKGRQITLLKPSTYVNLSGKAVKYWMDKEKVPIKSILIVTDDLSLPFGKLRLRAKGNDGGHNGLKSINDTLNSSSYARLRFGIGNDFPKGRQVDHVLGEWDPEEEKMLNENISKACDAALSFTKIGINETMNKFNQ